MSKTTSLDKQIDICISCLTCTACCPVFEAYGDEALLTNAPAGFLQGYRYMEKWGMDYNEELRQSLFDCKTCAACEQLCAMSLPITRMVRELRSRYLQELVKESPLPAPLQEVLANARNYGNPWGPSLWNRDAWARNLSIKNLSQGHRTEFLYFIGCRQDKRSQKLAEAVARVLQKAGVDFGVLGDAETCCGDIVLRLGDTLLFQTLASKTTKVLQELGIQKVVTTSPHCYRVLKNDYSKLGVSLEVQHVSELLARLIDEGRLAFSRPVPKVVTYHDPCYLGRHSKVYDAPRAVLKAIPGLTLVEMDRHRDNSLCCGGGGGGEWLKRDLEYRIANRRAEQAIATGAKVIATACPSCLRMLEDAVSALGQRDKIVVRDLIEIVEEVL